jgi:hypothetical protein
MEACITREGEIGVAMTTSSSSEERQATDAEHDARGDTGGIYRSGQEAGIEWDRREAARNALTPTPPQRSEGVRRRPAWAIAVDEAKAQLQAGSDRVSLTEQIPASEDTFAPHEGALSPEARRAHWARMDAELEALQQRARRAKRDRSS